jgi:FixJ family two-component response regulator
MPDMSGVDLQRALTEQGIDIPVIVLTGHADKNRLVVLAVAIQKFVSDHVQMPVENRLSPRRTDVVTSDWAWNEEVMGARYREER